MKYILKYRRNNKEKFWETKEMSSLLAISNFLDRVLEDTLEQELECKIIKCVSKDTTKQVLKD